MTTPKTPHKEDCSCFNCSNDINTKTTTKTPNEEEQRKLYTGLIIMGIIGFSLIRLILIVEGKTNYVWMDFVGIIILSLVLLGLIKPFQKDLK